MPKQIIGIISASLLLMADAYAQDNKSIVASMYQSADLIIEGTILDIHCIQDEVGVLNCSYGVRVDSIFKGEPITHVRQIYNSGSYGYPLQSDALAHSIDSVLPGVELLNFQRDCFCWLQQLKISETSDYCPILGERLLIFLTAQANGNDVYSYTLLDRFFGTIPANPYLARELKRLEKY